ncbi:MAG: DUF3987 domain-containing protein [Desulfovibrio sp.]|uniref:DUF3987 domain-containing protein n=1 Tax=Desulfovibrio sp. TaxID=885 RepID=UPI001A71042B|nr:DUF3987 domain-containing protein [Desulfovibrio sp.]MBD5417082.1 DUF3987 domain-containing protein [Desulfovibrio sp.]
MSSALDFQALNEAALAHCPGLLERLLPGGKLSGAEYVCGNLGGGPGASCSVNVHSGKWADFAAGQGGGDLISLVAEQRGVNQVEAARLLGDMVGRPVETLPPRANTAAAKPQAVMPVPDGVFPPAEHKHPRLGTAAAVYRYEDAAGRLLGFVARFTKQEMDSRGKLHKEFAPRVYTVKGWRWQGFTTPRPLYGLPRLAKAPAPAPVVLVEGEGKADALQAVLGGTVPVLGLFGGSGGVKQMDFAPLAGRRVVYWPDADAPGAKAALLVCSLLEQAGAAAVSVAVPPEGAPHGWDGGDAVGADGWDYQRVVEFLRDAAISPADFANVAAARWNVTAPGPELTASTTGDSSQDTWGEPVPFAAHDLPGLDAASLPPILGDFCSALAEEKQVPVEIAVAMALAALATAAQGRFMVRIREGYEEPLNLYTLCPLEPANRKSAVVESCIAPLREWERRMAENMAPLVKKAKSARLTMEKAIEAARARAAKKTSLEEIQALQSEVEELEEQLPEVPAVPRLLADNTTPEALAALMENVGGCVAILTAEGGIFDILAGMYSKGTPNLDLFLKAHSGDSFRVDRRWAAPILLDHPRLTLGISPQPVTLSQREASRVFRGRGLDGRFLYFMPESLLGRRKMEPDPMPAPVRDRFHNAILDLLPRQWDGDPPAPMRLELSQDAYRLWHDFAAGVEKGLAPGGEFEGMSDWGGKLPGAVARIAALFHLIGHERPADAKIDGETMRRAAYMGALLAAHAKAAYDLMGTDNRLEGGKRVLEWIRRRALQQFSARDCFHGVRGQTSIFTHMEVVQAALEELEERGFIRELPLGRPAGPGRKPSPQYQVNPATLRG